MLLITKSFRKYIDLAKQYIFYLKSIVNSLDLRIGGREEVRCTISDII